MKDLECRAQISAHLLHLGVKPGGTLLIHSSMKSLGPVPGGIQTLIDGLQDALGPNGTLLMPALSYETVTRAAPFFDVRNTPSCVGAIPEYFRKLDGTLRSMHPTHSMSGQGPMAGELLGKHIFDTTPCGINSPFTKLKDFGGQVLMLGCGLLHNTMMHAAEEAAGAPYLFEAEPICYTLTGYNGVPMEVMHIRHTEFPQHFDRVRPGLIGNGLTEGKVLEAQCHLYYAGALWKHALEMLNNDIYCFYKD